MAEIKTAIKIVDGFTPVLRSLNTALNLVTSSLTDVQGQMGRPIDLSSINAARAELAKVSASLDAMGADATGASAKQDRLNQEMDEGAGAASKLTSYVKGLAAAYATWQTVGTAIKMSDDLTTMNARLALINDGSQSQAELQDKIFNLAQRTSSTYADTAAFVARINMNAKDAFKTNDEAILFAEVLQKKFAIAGASAEEIGSVMLQMTQALGAGALRGEELNSVFEAAPNIIQSIADYLGKPIGKIRDMAGEGKITADIVKKAMFASIEETNKQFNAMPDTFGGVWTRMKNYALKAFEPVLKKLNELVNSKEFQALTKAVVGAMVMLASGVVSVANLITSAFGFVKNNLDLLAPVIYGIAAAVGVWGGALAFAKAQALATVAAHAVLKAGMIAMTFATQGATAGFAALNAVMSINPVTLVVLAVVALIAAFYGVIALINRFCDTSISATGLITGAFAGLFAMLYNGFAYVMNVAASLGEFLINVFTNPIYSIKALFVGLATNFIDATIGMIGGWDSFVTSMANGFLDAINWILRGWNKFVEALPDSVASTLGLGKAEEFQYSTSITSDLTDAKKQLQSMLGEKPETYTTVDKLAYKDVREYANSGYKWGADKAEQFDLSTTLSDAFSSADKLTAGLTSDTSKADLSGIPAAQSALDKIAANTGKTADALNKPNEELKFLREIGEREAVYRLSTNNVKLDMTNNNTVNSELDLDAMTEAFANKLRNAMNNMAEGVHN